MADPPGQAMLNDVGDIAPSRGDAGDRCDVIDLERVLHPQQKPKPKNSKHASTHAPRARRLQKVFPNHHSDLTPFGTKFGTAIRVAHSSFSLAQPNGEMHVQTRII